MHKDVIINRICYDRMRVRVFILDLKSILGTNLALLTTSRDKNHY